MNLIDSKIELPILFHVNDYHEINPIEKILKTIIKNSNIKVTELDNEMYEEFSMPYLCCIYLDELPSDEEIKKMKVLNL